MKRPLLQSMRRLVTIAFVTPWIASLDYTVPVTNQPVPANRSPYEAMLNRSVYDAAPMSLNVKQEPAGLPGQSHAVSRPGTGAPLDGEDLSRELEVKLAEDPLYSVK